jgi:hypothetical protein
MSDDQMAAVRARFSKWQIERWRQTVRDAEIAEGDIDDWIAEAADQVARHAADPSVSEDFKISLMLAVKLGPFGADGDLTADALRLKRMMHVGADANPH